MSLEPGAGRLLVATTGLLDPNFFRTVVLVCRYDAGRGTLGIVLNRPTEIEVGKVIPKIASGREERLWVGGPVDGRTLWALHQRADLPQRGDEVLDGVFFGAHPRMIRRLLRTNAPDADGGIFRLFVGYAGWSAGQLEGEIEEGAWRIVPAGAPALFTGGHAGLWGEMTMRSLLTSGMDGGCIRNAWLN